jgi:hypothetical protein
VRRVRMLTTGAGPEGVMPSGAVVLVADEMAERLVAGGYAEEVITTESTESTEERPQSAEIETASMEPAAEQAVAPAQRKPRRRKAKRTTEDTE